MLEYRQGFQYIYQLLVSGILECSIERNSETKSICVGKEYQNPWVMLYFLFYALWVCSNSFSLSLLPPPPLDFPANNIVKFLVGFTNKGTEDFIVESLDASFRYPQDYQFYIQNFTALPLNTVVPPQRQATFEYSFIPAEPMGGRPFGLVINLNYKDLNVRPSKLFFS